MNKEDQKFSQIITAIDQKRIHLAQSLMKTWVDELRNGAFFDRLESLTSYYNYLLQYFVQDINDPQRPNIYNKLIACYYELANDLYEAIRKQQSSYAEFALMREQKQKNAADYQRIKQILDRYSEEIASREDYEAALNDLFNIFWLSSQYTMEIVQLYNQIITDENLGDNEKCLAVSALTLNVWRSFSKEKLNLLFDTCLQTYGDIQQRALVGFLFLLTKYDNYIPYFQDITHKLSLFVDRPELLSLTEKIVKQIIRTSETERIRQEMNNEIIPQLMKISPKLRSKLHSDILSQIDNEPNPDWSDFLGDQEIGKKMQKISEMQLDGSDVYFGTFAHLKRSDFFRPFSHWFLPFDHRWSTTAPLFDEQNSFLTMLLNNRVFCNSDKYSFCFSITSMPENEQKNIVSSLGAEMAQIEDSANDNERKQDRQEFVSNQYIQDLYRFFKLKQNTSPESMFEYALRMHRTSWFQQLFADKQVQLRIANFYVAKQAYREAAELFETLEKIIPTAELFQKKGYSLQQLGELTQAIKAYERADLIASENIWTLKHLATCYRLQGEFSKALDYYQQIRQLSPTDKNNLLNMGLCLLGMQKIEEAMQLYYKLDIDFAGDLQVERAIAWCAFMAGKHEQSQCYWERVLTNNPTVDDYLNAAHNAWCLCERQLALQYYKKSIKSCKSSTDFWKKFQADVPYLTQRGISELDLALMSDAI